MIGLYDSGVGGLSVWKEVYRLMPEQDYVYVADTAYCPYGDKPVGIIRDRAVRVSEFLMGKGADIIVVACNTATAAAIACLRSRFEVPFVGMEPAVKPAAAMSSAGVIGVLATANTFKGELYHNTLARVGDGVRVVEVVGEGLVEAVENGQDATALLERYVGRMLSEGVDVIVLGCTHFPFLEDTIRKIAGPGVAVVNPAPAVARQVARIASAMKGGHPSAGESVFYATGPAVRLERMAAAIVGSKYNNIVERLNI